uniref:EF-hand domain-containing protein n=1 Tax=Steinernema glaseri TaxID=37863 RepID=A0A1I8AGV2_9BILA
MFPIWKSSEREEGIQTVRGAADKAAHVDWSSGIGIRAMLRVICLFHTTNQQGVQYIVRSRPDRWVDTSSNAVQTEYFYTVGVERLTTRGIEAAIRIRLIKGKTNLNVKGVVHQAIANPLEGRRIYRTYFVPDHTFRCRLPNNDKCEWTSSKDLLSQVPDHTFRCRLPNNDKYEWTSSKDLLSQVARGKISANVGEAVKALEEGLYMPMTEVNDVEMNVSDVVKAYENLFTDNQRVLLKDAGFASRQMDRIYRMYLEIVWPNSIMNFDEFDMFFRNHEMRMGGDTKSLFRSFSLSKEDGINFFDFVLGLAAIQPDTPHGKTSGDLRTRYIFR